MNTRMPAFGPDLLAAVLGASLFAARDSRAGESPAPPPPPLVFAFELRVKVADPVVIGEVPHGLRRIIAITGGAPRAPQLFSMEEAARVGADRVLMKPVGMQELLAAVSALAPSAAKE